MAPSTATGLMAGDTLAMMRTASNTSKMTKAVRDQWEKRSKIRAIVDESTSPDVVARAQIDEVFLVLSHLGEAILKLGVFNKDYYMQTLGEVTSSLESCGHGLLLVAWGELSAELQYVCTAAFALCAMFAPLHVYRGFGACTLAQWDWACPDIAHLEEKARKRALWTVYGIKQKTDPQPTRAVFKAFDQAMQILQGKPMAFLENRPSISSFADRHPRYGTRHKKEVKDHLDLMEDWVKQLEKRGHPMPSGINTMSYGIPFATWTSTYSCHLLRSEKDCETIMLEQMDPGRLLHAFVCGGRATVDDGQIILLPPRSPAETLLCWLEDRPGMTHKIVSWQDLNTTKFESKISKSLRKRVGQYPLPIRFAIAGAPSLVATKSSPSVLEHANTVSPPPYNNLTPRPNVAELHEGSNSVAELGAPEVKEIDSTSLPGPSRSEKTAAASQFTSPSRIPAKASELPESTILRKPLSSGGLSDAGSSRSASTPLLKNVIEPLKTSNTAPAAFGASGKSAEPEAITAFELPTEIQSPSAVSRKEAEAKPEKSQNPELAQDAKTEEPTSLESQLLPSEQSGSSSPIFQETNNSGPVASHLETAQAVQKEEPKALEAEAQTESNRQDESAIPVVVIEDTSIPKASEPADSTPTAQAEEPDLANGETVTKSSEQEESSTPGAVIPDALIPGKSQITDSTTEAPQEEPKQGSEAPDVPPKNQYLELLAKAAKGEISPQELAEILQKGDLLKDDSK